MKGLIILMLICGQVWASEVVGSYGQMGLVKSLFGEYLREQNTDPARYENRIVGNIGDHCTGTLIGPRHVLTAAHCVYDLSTSRFEEDLSFNPGQVRPDSIPYKKVEWRQIYMPKKYDLESGDYTYDFAVIEIKENIGEKLGWAGFKVSPMTRSLTISIVGYPHDKEIGTQWKVTCPSQVGNSEITYRCDTFGGMSGSAVFEDLGDKRSVIGIHVFGDRYTNGAVRITDSRFKMIHAWTLGKTDKDTLVIKNTK